jgi:DNA-binding transcriptional ArsR family regulator
LISDFSLHIFEGMNVNGQLPPVHAPLDPAAMDRAAEAACELLRSLASPVRLKILCQLSTGELPVGELAARLGVRETLASQHLALLRKDGLVRARREGRSIFYRIASPAAARVVETLYELFCADGVGGLQRG